MRSRALAGVLATALSLAACAGGDGGDAPSPTPDPLATGSTTDAQLSDVPSSDAASPSGSAAVDVTTTPDPITEDWAEAVVNELNAAYGDVLAETLAIPTVDTVDRLPADFEPRIRALFTGAYEEGRIAEWSAIATDQDDRRDLLVPADEFEGVTFDSVALQYRGDECVIVLGTIDDSRGAAEPQFGDLLFAYSLAPAGADDVRGNVTEWVIQGQLANTSPAGERNEDQALLDADLAEYGSALPNGCSEDDRVP